MAVHDWTRVEAGIFHEFHCDWIFTLKATLNQGLLPPDYYALAEQVAGGLHPDVLTLEWSRADRSPDTEPPARAGIGVAEMPPKVQFVAAAESAAYARKRNRIAIRHAGGDQVVAVVEIVSPGNKGSRQALRFFVEKAAKFLDAGIHLLVLDLFPPGARDPEGIHAAIWSEIIEHDFRMPEGKRLTLASYSAGPVKRAFIEPVSVGSVLPPMPLFLEPDFYIYVPLEASYQTAFEAVPERWRAELARAGE